MCYLCYVYVACVVCVMCLLCLCYVRVLGVRCVCVCHACVLCDCYIYATCSRVFMSITYVSCERARVPSAYYVFVMFDCVCYAGLMLVLCVGYVCAVCVLCVLSVCYVRARRMLCVLCVCAYNMCAMSLHC